MLKIPWRWLLCNSIRLKHCSAFMKYIIDFGMSSLDICFVQNNDISIPISACFVGIEQLKCRIGGQFLSCHTIRRALYRYMLLQVKQIIELFTVSLDIVCPRSSYRFYLVTYYIKWGALSWTYSRRNPDFILITQNSDMTFVC